MAKYNIPVWGLSNGSDEELKKWAADPECVEMEACAKALVDRAEYRIRRRRMIEENPFDPRTEISADAKRIVMTLWIILVILPFIAALLFYIVR
jgi:hypothetical protein